MSPVRTYVELARPFTLIAPALGFVSGALTAIGAHPHEVWHPGLLVPALIGCVMAMVFNAGNNALNQIYDLEIDRVNKGKRPLPSGRLTIRRGVDLHERHLRHHAGARVARRSRRAPRVLLDRAHRDDRDVHLLDAAAAHETARHLGERHDRDPARRAAQGRRMVRGQDGGGRRAVVHRHGVRPLPARRVDDQGFRGHGRRPAGWLPHAADRLRREARGVDDLAVVRPAVSADQRRHRVRHPHRPRRCCSTRSAS